MRMGVWSCHVVSGPGLPQLRRVKLPARADLPIVFSIGLVQMAAMFMLMNFGLTSVAAGRSAILSYTTPLWVVPGAMLILGERCIVKAMALLLALAGVAFMFNPLGFDWSDHKAIVGNGYLLAAVLWAERRFMSAPIACAARLWHWRPGRDARLRSDARFVAMGRGAGSPHRLFLERRAARALHLPW